MQQSDGSGASRRAIVLAESKRRDAFPRECLAACLQHLFDHRVGNSFGNVAHEHSNHWPRWHDGRLGNIVIMWLLVDCRARAAKRRPWRRLGHEILKVQWNSEATTTQSSCIDTVRIILTGMGGAWVDQDGLKDMVPFALDLLSVPN
jgi:hypothetical protein